MSGLRQAALALHGLAPVDRDWMLSRLPAQRAGELRDLLDELQEIGIPPDPELISHAIAARPNAATQPSARASRAASLSAGQAHELLAGEPDGLVATVLAGGEWSWREGFLAQLPVDRARHVRALASSLSVGPALRQAVLETFAARAELCSDEVPAPVASISPRRWMKVPREWAQRWRAWTR